MRRVPKVVGVRGGYVPSNEVNANVTQTTGSGNVVACHRSYPPGPTPAAVAGFEFLRFTNIVWAITGIDSDAPITVELSLVGVSGTGLAISGVLNVTPSGGRVTGIWAHGVSEINDSFVWAYMTTNASGNISWNMAMVNT